jgi:acyl-CoA thioesterase-1
VKNLVPFLAVTFWLASVAAGAASDVPPTQGVAASQGAALSCSVPPDLYRLDHPLARTAKHLAAGDPVKIVALGSSSTAGAGASSPAASYPSRLQAELSALFPNVRFTVINRGANGEDAREMMARFESSVLAEQPDLVIWQVGTNSILRDQPLEPAGSLIHQGIERLKAAGVDVILVDPQFAPKVLAKIDIDHLVELLESEAKRENVDLFRRFAVMRHWRQVANIPYSHFLSPDELHMNDWSYACFGKLLAVAIADAATRSTLTATARPSAALAPR